MLFNDSTFTRSGLTFRFNTEHDTDAEAPWDREDGHGPVSDQRYHPFGMGSNPPKAPGERILYWDRGYFRAYDWAEAMKIAKRDGWGLGADDIAKLAHRLGRVPTNGDIAAEAVHRDFERLRRWCGDQWRYVGVIVTLMVEDDDGELVDYDGPLRAKFMDSLWGVEDDEAEYLEETAHELADGIAAAYLAEQAEAKHWAERDVTTEA